VVVRHEFDTKLTRVISSLADLRDVDGITYRDGDAIIDNGDGKFETNLDQVPFPDRETVPWHWYVEA
jgi:radical SAM superfamily enzyme YgiQ (UPF0313 family)